MAESAQSHPVDRYRVNDVLGALAGEFGVELDDHTLNELTHHVADVIDVQALENEDGTNGT